MTCGAGLRENIFLRSQSAVEGVGELGTVEVGPEKPTLALILDADFIGKAMEGSYYTATHFIGPIAAHRK